MYLVVGSGPAGVSAAAALLDAGLPVTMVDVGNSCDPQRLAVVRRLAALPPEQWQSDDLARIRGPAQWDPTIPKLCFGSDFPYARGDTGLAQRGTRCLMSFARGGLSNVWGAAVLPNRAEELDDWPFGAADLAPHYGAAARLLGIAGEHDELESIFPFFGEPEPAPRMSRQAQALLERMRRHRDELSAAKLHFGQSRLALRTRARNGLQPCQYTGLCLSGCPYGAIWNSADVVEDLIARRGLHYRTDLMVLRAESTPGGVRLVARDQRSGSEIELSGERAFLACGPISTARVVIDSLRAYGTKLPLPFQPYFLVPLLTARNAGDVASERLHTLAQLNLELVDASISRYAIHMQVYSFNEVIRDQVERATRWLPWRTGLQRSLLGRLLAIQGYLHSSEADPVALIGELDPTLGYSRLVLSAPDLARTRAVVRRAVGRVAACARQIGAMPLLPLLRYGDPGEGNHVGGIFPMRVRPAPYETDALGQLAALPRVHLVDAAALPSLAATTLTYTVMANAHRIATAAARIDNGS